MNETARGLTEVLGSYGLVGCIAIFFLGIAIIQYKQYQEVIKEIKKERDELRKWKDEFYEERFKEYENIIQNNTQAYYENRSVMGNVETLLREILKKGINN